MLCYVTLRYVMLCYVMLCWSYFELFERDAKLTPGHRMKRIAPDDENKLLNKQNKTKTKYICYKFPDLAAEFRPIIKSPYF